MPSSSAQISRGEHESAFPAASVRAAALGPLPVAVEWTAGGAARGQGAPPDRAQERLRQRPGCDAWLRGRTRRRGAPATGPDIPSRSRVLSPSPLPRRLPRRGADGAGCMRGVCVVRQVWSTNYAPWTLQVLPPTPPPLRAPSSSPRRPGLPACGPCAIHTHLSSCSDTRPVPRVAGPARQLCARLLPTRRLPSCRPAVAPLTRACQP